jgi:hypothetical protein
MPLACRGGGRTRQRTEPGAEREGPGLGPAAQHDLGRAQFLAHGVLQGAVPSDGPKPP